MSDSVALSLLDAFAEAFLAKRPRLEKPFNIKTLREMVAAFIAGQTAPPGKRMGHAGAIISGGTGTAAEKMAAFEAAGVPVARIPSEIPGLIAEALRRRRVRAKSVAAKGKGKAKAAVAKKAPARAKASTKSAKSAKSAKARPAASAKGKNKAAARRRGR